MNVARVARSVGLIEVLIEQRIQKGRKEMEEELDRSTFIRTRHPNKKLPRDIHCKNLDFLFQTLSGEIVKVNDLHEGKSAFCHPRNF